MALRTKLRPSGQFTEEWVKLSYIKIIVCVLVKNNNNKNNNNSM